MVLLVLLTKEIAKNWPQMKKNKGLFHEDGNALGNAYAFTLFSIFGPLRLIFIHKSQKPSPEREIAPLRR